MVWVFSDWNIINNFCDSLEEVGDTVSKLLFNYVFFFPKKNTSSHLYPSHCIKAKIAKTKQGPKEMGKEENAIFGDIQRERFPYCYHGNICLSYSKVGRLTLHVI